MKTEDQLCARYETELASFAAIDRRYYSIPSPTLAERRGYAARQVQLEETRCRFYTDLAACRIERLRYVRQFRRCRFALRRSRRNH